MLLTDFLVDLHIKDVPRLRAVESHGGGLSFSKSEVGVTGLRQTFILTHATVQTMS